MCVCACVCACGKKTGEKTPQLRLLHRCVAAARGLLLLLVEVSLLLLQLLIGHDFCKDMPGGGHSALSTRGSALFSFIFLEDGKGQCYRIVDFVLYFWGNQKQARVATSKMCSTGCF